MWFSTCCSCWSWYTLIKYAVWWQYFKQKDSMTLLFWSFLPTPPLHPCIPVYIVSCLCLGFLSQLLSLGFRQRADKSPSKINIMYDGAWLLPDFMTGQIKPVNWTEAGVWSSDVWVDVYKVTVVYQLLNLTWGDRSVFNISPCSLHGSHWECVCAVARPRCEGVHL